jgi:purine-binding chemotaxis protein CheW
MAQRNLLCCNLADENIAVPLERVVGVVEGGLVTPLPWTAAGFEGLVEAIGQVMPQVDLAAILGVREATGGILVVVSDRGGSLALRVRQATAMIQVDGDAFASTAVRARERNPLYLAEIVHQSEIYHILDLDLLATSESLQVTVPDGAVMLAGATPEAIPAEAVDESQIPFLLLEIAGERYAVRTSAIAEMNVAGSVTVMPGSPDWIAGLIDLRGAPLVAISTASLLGLSAPESSTLQRDVCLIVEIKSDIEAAGFRVALFFDRALGLERISPSLIYTMPQTMAGVESYFVLNDNDIVGIIDPVALFAQVETELRACIPRASAEPQAIAGTNGGSQYSRLLTVRVGRELYGITLDRIERIQASAELTPLPTDIHYFDGLADVGDAIVPVIDLRRQQGTALTPFEMSDRPPCILARLEGAVTGILVDQVLTIQNIPLERFEPVSDASNIPISHVVSFENRLISVLTIDRLLPAY